MTFNVPPILRASIYIVTAVLSPVMSYLLARGLIGDLEMKLYYSLVSVVATMAALNTAPDKKAN